MAGQEKLMNPILNREFEHPADGWYNIEAIGDHPNKEAGIVQVIDQKAAQSIVNDFNEQADDPNFPGMLVDHEHFKHDSDKDTVAYGWLTRLQARPDGIYGQIRWTGTGQAAVDNGDYRFFSTEYPATAFEPADRNDLSRQRPLRLGGLTLTNCPNNTGQRPITNSNRTDHHHPMSTELASSPSGEARELAAAIASREGCSFDTAWNRVRTSHPHLFEKAYNRQAEADASVINRSVAFESRGRREYTAMEIYHMGMKPAGPGKWIDGRFVLNSSAVLPGEEALSPVELVEAIEHFKFENRVATYTEAHDQLRQRHPGWFGNFGKV
jgi:phage I-like protein